MKVGPQVLNQRAESGEQRGKDEISVACVERPGVRMSWSSCRTGNSGMYTFCPLDESNDKDAQELRRQEVRPRTKNHDQA